MKNITMLIRLIIASIMISIIQVILVARTSAALTLTSELIPNLNIHDLQHKFLAQSSKQKAVDYLMLGAQKAKQLDYNGALVDFDRAIQIDPNFSYAYNARGAIKSESKDFRGGLADFNRAIQLDPNLAGAYKNRAVLKTSKLNDIQGGLADFNRAIQIDPNYAVAYYRRAILKHDRLNDRAGGIADIQQAIKLYRQQGLQGGTQEAMTLLKKWQETKNKSSLS
jgi:tetratricopeptide (TPR) repeat protein